MANHIWEKNHMMKKGQREIEATGIKVMRFWNTEVYDDFEPVLEAIWQECERRRVMPSPPAPLPEYWERGE